MPQEALTSFTVSDAYRIFWRSGIVIEVRKLDHVGSIEYIIPKNNIIVLDSYFKLTNKSDLIHRFWYDLTIFDHLVVDYFFGPPCIVGTQRLFLLVSVINMRCLWGDSSDISRFIENRQPYNVKQAYRIRHTC